MNKNKQILKIAGVFLALVLVIAGIIGRGAFRKIDLQKKEDKKAEITVTVSQNVCDKYSAEFVSKIIEKPVLKTESSENRSNSECIYFIGEDGNISITIENNQDIDNQKKSLTLLDEIVATDAAIPMNHFIALKKDQSLKEIYLVLGSASYINISQSSGDLVSKEKLIFLSQKIAEDVSGKKQNSVPLPSPQSIISTFFALINEKKVPAAISMMDEAFIGNDSSKKQWETQFSSFESLTVGKIDVWDKENWDENRQKYKVNLNIEMSAKAKGGAIPNYGWENGENTRWLTLVKKEKMWKISGISTGP